MTGEDGTGHDGPDQAATAAVLAKQSGARGRTARGRSGAPFAGLPAVLRERTGILCGLMRMLMRMQTRMQIAGADAGMERAARPSATSERVRLTGPPAFSRPRQRRANST